MAYGNQGWRLATISHLDYDDTQIHERHFDNVNKADGIICHHMRMVDHAKLQPFSWPLS